MSFSLKTKDEDCLMVMLNREYKVVDGKRYQALGRLETVFVTKVADGKVHYDGFSADEAWFKERFVAIPRGIFGNTGDVYINFSTYKYDPNCEAIVEEKYLNDWYNIMKDHYGDDFVVYRCYKIAKKYEFKSVDVVTKFKAHEV